MTTTFKAIEDNAGGLHLYVFDGDKCICGGGGYQEIPGLLQYAVSELRKNGVDDFRMPEDEDQGWTEMEASMDKYPHGYKVVADEEQDYPDRMGVAASMDWALGKAAEERDNQKPNQKPNLLAAAIAAPTIDAAIKPIMDALGIVSGDVAGQSFHGYSQNEWHHIRPHDRVLLIASWLIDEVWSAAP